MGSFYETRLAAMKKLILRDLIIFDSGAANSFAFECRQGAPRPCLCIDRCKAHTVFASLDVPNRAFVWPGVRKNTIQCIMQVDLIPVDAEKGATKNLREGNVRDCTLMWLLLQVKIFHLYK